jgi:hypothetical protein
MAGYQPEVSASGWFAIGLFDIAVKARQGRPIAVLDPTRFTGQQPFEAPQASYSVGPSGVDAIGIDAISPATAGQSKSGPKYQPHTDTVEKNTFGHD